ncbi:MAG: hypothetical protein Ct9H300mP1_29610 [Planctomycetaceae bacterium]|nr:MAG: hypothetical protein Ct9H300mP1_29610 [Planctomycetaceae bacterium]
MSPRYLSAWWARHESLEVVGCDLCVPAFGNGRDSAIDWAGRWNWARGICCPRRRRAVRVDRGSGRVARGDRGGVARPGRLVSGVSDNGWLALDRPPAGCGLESAGEGETAIGRTGVGGFWWRDAWAEWFRPKRETLGSEHVRLSTRGGGGLPEDCVEQARQTGRDSWNTPGIRTSGPGKPWRGTGPAAARAVRGSVPTRRRPGSGAHPGSRRPWRSRRPVPGGCRAWQRAPRTSPGGRPVRRPGDRSLR